MKDELSETVTAAEKFPGYMGSLNVEGIDSIFADDILCRAPFAPEGLQKVLHGKEAVSQNFAVLPAMFRLVTYSQIEVVETLDDDFAIAFAHADAVLANGSPYTQDYVFCFKINPDGKLCEYREYMNSQVQAEAMAAPTADRG